MPTKQQLGKATIGLLVFDVFCIIIATAIDQWMVSVSGTVSNTLVDKALKAGSMLNSVLNWGSRSVPKMNGHSGGPHYIGLWAECTLNTKHLAGDWICSDLKEVSIAIKCVRAMVLLGLFFVSGATFIFTAHMYRLKDNRQLLFAATGLLVFAGLFLMIGFGVYHAKVYGPRALYNTLHAGFAFCVIAWISTCLGIGLTVKIACMAEE